MFLGKWLECLDTAASVGISIVAHSSQRSHLFSFCSEFSSDGRDVGHWDANQRSRLPLSRLVESCAFGRARRATPGGLQFECTAHGGNRWNHLWPARLEATFGNRDLAQCYCRQLHLRPRQRLRLHLRCCCFRHEFHDLASASVAEMTDGPARSRCPAQQGSSPGVLPKWR